MTISEALFLIVVFVSNTLQAITGFAGTVLAMPPSMLLIGTSDARVVLNILALVSSLGIAATSWRSIDFRQLMTMSLLMAVGMVIGVGLYSKLPLAPLKIAYGAFILAVATWNLLRRPSKNENGGNLTLPTTVLVLVGAGVIHGLFVSGGALLIVYAAKALPDKDTFRSTVASVWILLNSVLLVQQMWSGEMSFRALQLTSLSLIPLVIATILGTLASRRITQGAFLRMTYALLAVSGLSILV